jgi:hypothetical protein
MTAYIQACSISVRTASEAVVPVVLAAEHVQNTLCRCVRVSSAVHLFLV